MEKYGVKLGFMSFFVKAVVDALQAVPAINSRLDGEDLILNNAFHIGVAVGTERGLIVPVLHDVQTMSFRELVRAFEDLKKRAQSNLLKPHEFKDGTISLSNFGVLGGGGQWATPIINHPQVAILAIARVQKQPVIKNDAVVACDVMNLCWSFDHRIIDGDLAANISYYFTKLIENPAQLL